MTTHLEYSSDKLRGAQVEGIREAHRTACERPPARASPARAPTRCIRLESAVLTGDFNMKPRDPVNLRLSQKFESGAPALVDSWTGSMPNRPPGFVLRLRSRPMARRIAATTSSSTEDLAPRLSASLRHRTRASDHQPVLVDIDDA
jgi:endonuclease/exonuclease/phosphatase family metal-dependent hydrolase